MRDGSKTKQRIAESALRLFVENGLGETSVRDIARAAGIAEGALYRHYASKEDLAWRLFADGFVALARRLEALAGEAPDFRARLAALVREFCRAYDEDPVLFAYLLLSQHSQVRKVTPQMPSPLEVVRRVVAEGLAARDDRRRDPQLVAAMIMGVVLQVAVERTYGRIGASLSELAGPLSAACWRIVTA